MRLDNTDTPALLSNYPVDSFIKNNNYDVLDDLMMYYNIWLNTTCSIHDHVT